MRNITDLINETIKVKLNGCKEMKGMLIDSGNDIIVLYDGSQYIYISHFHIHHLEVCTKEEDKIVLTGEEFYQDDASSISLRKTLQESRGVFTEIYVTGNHSIHGYITSIMNDYFVFFSPIYKNMYISLKHLKWLIPYPPNVRPYDLTQNEFPVSPTSISLARTLEEQLKKVINQVVIFDVNEHPFKVGKITAIQDNQITLTRARNDDIYVNLHHIKSVHFP